nr:MAG TPA_asm: hypothetical protein [Bacteriophage sp.]
MFPLLSKNVTIQNPIFTTLHKLISHCNTERFSA